MSKCGDNFYKLSVNFFGVSTVALIAAILLHEFGHLFALFLFEGKLGHLRFHPFAGASIVHVPIHPQNVIFVTLGGVLIGGLLGGLITLSLWKFRTPFLSSFLMIGVAALGGNGLMLVVGSLFSDVGDVSKLISVGLSKGVLLILGLSFLLLGFIFFLFLQPYLGISQDDRLLKRCSVFLGGLMPYSMSVLIYNRIFNVGALNDYVTYITGG